MDNVGIGALLILVVMISFWIGYVVGWHTAKNDKEDADDFPFDEDENNGFQIENK